MFRWLTGFRFPKVPDHLLIEDVRYYRDGGTTVFITRDERGEEHTVTLTQRAFPGRNAGRLYLDGSKVPRRGDTERGILRLLRDCLERLKQHPDAGRPSDQEWARRREQQGLQRIEEEGVPMLRGEGVLHCGSGLDTACRDETRPGDDLAP